MTTGGTATYTYTGVDYQAALGGSTGYVGFTGATDGSDAQQTISNFQFSEGVGAPSA